MSCLKFSTFSEKHEANKNKYGLKITVYKMLLWEANGVRTSPFKAPRFGPRPVIWVAL